MKSPRIKVCGLTRVEDIRLLEQLGVDAVGFILHPNSPRRVSLSEARELREIVPPTMLVFGVLPVHTNETLLRTASSLRLDVLQVHGAISQRSIRLLQREGYRIAPVFNPSLDDSWRDSEADMVVFDNSRSGLPGGTGSPFDWKTVKKPFPRHLMLAGGLREGNIAEAVAQFRPDIVDLNSGVETAPGIKSAKKLRAIVNLLRERR